MRVRPSAAPVPSGSRPYSAGRTIVTSIAIATNSAIAAVVASFLFDGSKTGSEVAGRFIYAPIKKPVS